MKITIRSSVAVFIRLGGFDPFTKLLTPYLMKSEYGNVHYTGWIRTCRPIVSTNNLFFVRKQRCLWSVNRITDTRNSALGPHTKVYCFCFRKGIDQYPKWNQEMYFVLADNYVVRLQLLTALNRLTTDNASYTHNVWAYIHNMLHSMLANRRSSLQDFLNTCAGLLCKLTMLIYDLSIPPAKLSTLV